MESVQDPNRKDIIMNLAQKLGLSLGAAALGIGAAFGVTTASASQTTTTTAASQTQNGTAQTQAGPGGQQGTSPQGDQRGGQMGAPQALVDGLASKLGLDATKVQAAVAAAFAQVGPSSQQGTTGTDPREAMDAAAAPIIAQQLGVDEAKVVAAMAELRSENPMTGAPDQQGQMGPQGQMGQPPAAGTTQTGTTG